MSAPPFLPNKRMAAAMAFMLISGCALQDKMKPSPQPQSAQVSPASLAGAEATASAPASDAAPEQKAAQPATMPETRAESENSLSTGIGLYDAGDYNGAIRQLQSVTRNRKGNKADHVRAVKYIAFSYCLTGRKILCRRNFVKAFKLDPGFDLDAGEKGHPLWGPEFEAAKRSVQSKAGRGAAKKK